MKKMLVSLLSIGLIGVKPVIAEDTQDPSVGGGAPEVVNVNDPDEQPEIGASNEDGIVKLLKIGDEFADVIRSGDVVERVALTNTNGCLSGVGQIGTVSFCGLSGAKLHLSGRPEFVCPSDSGDYYGPCALNTDS